MISASRVFQSGLLEHAKQLRSSALCCTVLEVEDYSTDQISAHFLLALSSVRALTFFNAILLWSLVVRVFMLLGDSFGTFVEMMLVADALT